MLNVQCIGECARGSWLLLADFCVLDVSVARQRNLFHNMIRGAKLSFSGMKWSKRVVEWVNLRGIRVSSACVTLTQASMVRKLHVVEHLTSLNVSCISIDEPSQHICEIIAPVKLEAWAPR